MRCAPVFARQGFLVPAQVNLQPQGSTQLVQYVDAHVVLSVFYLRYVLIRHAAQLCKLTQRQALLLARLSDKRPDTHSVY